MTQTLTTALQVNAPLLLSPRVEWHVDRLLRGFVVMPATVTAAERLEAKTALAVLERLNGRASLERIERWMEKVALGVSNPPNDEARLGRIGLVVETSGDLPIGVWTSHTRAAFARHRGVDSRFWPSDGEVDAFLRPLASKMRSMADALAAVGQPVPVPPVVEDVPVEERPISQLAGEERDKALQHVRMATQRWLKSRIPEVVETAEEVRARPGHLTGRALWEARNRARGVHGLLPLPEPKSFEGYGA